MNDSLAQQLFKAGLSKSPPMDDPKPVYPKPRSSGAEITKAGDLMGCQNTRDFREGVRAILLYDIARARDLINEVISIAHRFRDEKPGLFHLDDFGFFPGEDETKRFVWWLYAIRDELEKLPADQWPDFIRSATSKSGVKTMRKRASRR